MISGWRYYYRFWLGWLPIQFCMVCGKPYWGGWPVFRIEGLKFYVVWLAWYADYCSQECADEDSERICGKPTPKNQGGK
jgi:uncharacterized membrane protein